MYGKSSPVPALKARTEKYDSKSSERNVLVRNPPTAPEDRLLWEPIVTLQPVLIRLRRIHPEAGGRLRGEWGECEETKGLGAG